MTQKDVKDLGNSIPPPSGRGEDSTGEAESTQLLHDIHSWYAEQAVENQKKYEAERARRQLIWKINTWLSQRGSPMVGCAEYYVQNQERTGIPATLSVGIAEAESSSGMACYGPHNAWGMISYPGGWSSWEEGIRANFDWLVHYHGCPQNMNQCPGYCEGNGTMSGVNAVMRMIDSLDASGVQ